MAFPLGFGVLARGGVIAWRHALAQLAPAAVPAAPGLPAGPADGVPAPVAAELVSALAAVALAVAGGARL